MNEKLKQEVKPRSSKKPKAINWNEWNPFERATGEALRQLNKRQPKLKPEEGEEAPL
jgi:hypothetical protein